MLRPTDPFPATTRSRSTSRRRQKSPGRTRLHRQSQILSAQTPSASRIAVNCVNWSILPGNWKNTWPLPDGCFINYDLGFIDFLKSLDNNGLADDYATLREVLGRRPTLTEFYRWRSTDPHSSAMRRWFSLVASMGDPGDAERACSTATALPGRTRNHPDDRQFQNGATGSLSATQGLDERRSLPDLARVSWEILHRRPPLLADLPENIRQLSGDASRWQRSWRKSGECTMDWWQPH